MREIISLNGRWNFHRGDIDLPRPVDKGAVYIQSKNERKHIGPAAYYYFDKPDSYYAERQMQSEGWRYVTVPHDYIIDQDNDKTQNNAHGYFKYENAWYRKEFELGEEYFNKRILLEFDGIARRSEIYLNGSLMKRNFSAYNSFEVDITSNVYFDRKNVIAVYANTDDWEGWWYQGGGIYRDVRLVITDNVAIDRYGVYAPCKKIGEKEWQIDFETTLVNAGYQSSEIEIVSEVIDSSGNIVASAVASGEIAARDKRTYYYTAAVYDPRLWCYESPELYSVKTCLLIGGEALDENTVRIGFRTVELSKEKGLLINGKKTIIKGVNCHQDFGITGLAVTKNIAEYKIGLLKQMGANGYRTSHYQQTACILDALDEAGFYVLDETRWFETTEESYSYLEELVKRDRNRPSVIFWSTGNEERTHITEQGRRVHKAMADFIRKLDGTRIITTCEDMKPEKSTVFADSDIIAINYNLESYDTVHEQYPDKLMVGGECCATGTVRGWFLPTTYDNARIREEDVKTNSWYQAREVTWKHFMERPYIVGAYQWSGIEYRGESRWPRICSVSGAIDLFLQKKTAFYQNKSHWTDEPMAYICPHWNFKGMEGREISVDVYTNCDELELFLNGNSLGKKTIEKYGHGNWKVKYQPGTLSAKGYKNGVLVCEDERQTTGKAVRLSLRLENKFELNGEDVALFTCECLDENGLVVPDADEYVYFSTNADVEILGTGSDICDHVNVTSPERKMYAGKITVALRPSAEAEKVELYAQSGNCGIACWTTEDETH